MGPCLPVARCNTVYLVFMDLCDLASYHQHDVAGANKAQLKRVHLGYLLPSRCDGYGLELIVVRASVRTTLV